MAHQATLARRASASARNAVARPARAAVRPCAIPPGSSPTKTSRRELLLAAAALVMARPRVAGAVATPLLPPAAAGYQTFRGFNQQPDLYLGYGAAAGAPVQYSFEYPADWESGEVTKTEKSTMGMDGRVVHPRQRKELAYTLALGGKDYRDAVLKDAKTVLAVVAGGDPDMRQAVTDGTVKQSMKKINGTDVYQFDVASDKRRYLSSVAKRGDTVFALVVTAPAAAFERDAAQLHHIQDTFMLM